jgi:uncharacterized sporulation protein YeaH/YhbH (DUF444 family)
MWSDLNMNMQHGFEIGSLLPSDQVVGKDESIHPDNDEEQEEEQQEEEEEEEEEEQEDSDQKEEAMTSDSKDDDLQEETPTCKLLHSLNH